MFIVLTWQCIKVNLSLSDTKGKDNSNPITLNVFGAVHAHDLKSLEQMSIANINTSDSKGQTALWW